MNCQFHEREPRRYVHPRDEFTAVSQAYDDDAEDYDWSMPWQDLDGRTLAHLMGCTECRGVYENEIAYAEWSRGGHRADCDAEPMPDMDGSLVLMCNCPDVPCEDGSLSMGPREDPYGAQCELTRGDHWKQREAGRPHQHLAVNPLPGPGAEPQFLVWEGGGYCAGDPLAVENFHALDADESAALRQLA
jgi:hypothetical protein